MQPHRNMRQPGRIRRRLAQPGLGAGVVDDVRAFSDADVVGNRHERHARDQATGDGERRRRRRRGQYCDAPRAADPFGHRRRSPDQVAAGQRDPADPNGIADVGTGRDSGGVQ